MNDLLKSNGPDLKPVTKFAGSDWIKFIIEA